MNDFPDWMSIYIKGLDAFNNIMMGIKDNQYGDVSFDLEHPDGHKIKVTLNSKKEE